MNTDPASDPNRPRLMTTGEAAAYLGTGERFVRRLVAERRVPFYKLGAKLRIDESDLATFIANGRIELDASESEGT